MTAPVIVAGAGLAGTVAALAMRRAGVEVEVYEAYDGPIGDAGGLISLAVNGLRALRAIDCLDPLLDVGVTVPVMQAWSPRGRPVGQAPRHGSDRSDVASMTFLRGPMIERLHAEADRRGIRIHPGKRLVGSSPGSAGVVARFADGSEASGSVLVGADGAHSVTRQLIDPDTPVPEYAGVYVLGGSAPTPRELTGLAGHTFHAMLTEHGLFAFVLTGDDQVWWTAQLARPDAPPSAELRSLCSPGAGRERLAGRYGSHAAALIGATERFHTPTLMYRLAPVPVWRRSGMVLVGDAAHLVDAGIGGSLAIEDGLVLAKCLRDIAGRPEALERFEVLRRPRIDPMVAFGAKHKQGKTPHPLVKRFTLATLPLLMPVFMKLAGGKRAGRMFDYDVEWEVPLGSAPST